MTNLTNILLLLPKNKIDELTTISNRIIATSKAEFILLYGSYARGNYKEKRGKTRGKKSDYDILVVTSDYETKQEIKADLREAFTDIPVHVQLIVETIDFVNNNLEEKQFFFTDIKREGKVLYNSGNFKLSAPKKLTPKRRREIAEEDFKNWYKQADGFFQMYESSIEKKLYQIASFNLQQVVEMCYTTIEMVFNHYNPYEHDLGVLQMRVLKFNNQIKEVLPCNSKKEQELFDYLNYAYIGGRYRSEEEFPVTKEQLEYWSKEAKKLLDLTETICLERIECLKVVEKANENKKKK